MSPRNGAERAARKRSHLLSSNPKGMVCRTSSKSPLPPWRPDEEAWGREPFTHTITVTDLSHWLVCLSPGSTYQLAQIEPDQIEKGELYVFCQEGADKGPIRPIWGRPMSIGANRCVVLTTSAHRVTITSESHPLRYRVVGMAQWSGAARTCPYPRSETPVAVDGFRGRVFGALDAIESALIDAETTTALFAAMVDQGTSIDDACISAIERHLASDMAAVRAAFTQAHADAFQSERGEQ